jgi:hypothetical protein
MPDPRKSRAVSLLPSRAYLLFILVLLAPMLVVRCAGPKDRPIPIRSLLPGLHECGAWHPSGEARHYGGDDLFVYINGGAELYNEFGFKQVVVQEYQGPGDRTLSLEIYEMNDDDAAYGIYSLRTGAGGRALNLGDMGLFEDYYLNFRKARYLVTLTGFDDSKETCECLEKLAHVVDQRIPMNGDLPHLVRCLEPEDTVPGSINYFVGPLGLFNSGFFLAQGGFPFQEGAGAEYQGKSRVFLFRFSGEEDCSKAFEIVRSKAGSCTREKEGAYLLKPAGEDRLIHARQVGAYLIFTEGEDGLHRMGVLGERITAGP